MPPSGLHRIGPGAIRRVKDWQHNQAVERMRLDDIYRQFREANKLLGTTGQFWEREYFDRLIRNAAELERAVRYVVENPVKAGLKDWK